MMYYKEFQPGEQFKKHIDCFWEVRYDGLTNKESDMQRCLPLGMIELIVHTSSNHSYSLENGIKTFYPSSYFVGLMTKPAYWGMPPQCTMFGVRLKPEALLQLFKTSLADFFNDFVDAEQILGRQHSSIIRQLEDAKSTSDRIFLFESFLHNRLVEARRINHYISNSLELMRKDALNKSVDEISKTVNVGERQLQRLYKSTLGLSPKHYQRIVRFHEAYKLATHSNSNWTTIAHHTGYADQSHFIRDFKEFTGDSPSRLFKISGYGK